MKPLSTPIILYFYKMLENDELAFSWRREYHSFGSAWHYFIHTQLTIKQRSIAENR